MRIALAAVAVATMAALPSLADARPALSAGVGLGRTQDKVNADGDASDTMQVFGRLSFTKRLAAQLEFQKLSLPYGDTNVRSATLLLVVDLGHKGHFYPIMFGGFGGDKATDSYGYESSGSHKEGGLGLEYRGDGGFTLGLDLRLGGRSTNDEVEVLADRDVIAIYPTPGLQAGEYRSARLYAAIRF
jgi:hypothetical protein